VAILSLAETKKKAPTVGRLTLSPVPSDSAVRFSRYRGVGLLRNQAATEVNNPATKSNPAIGKAEPHSRFISSRVFDSFLNIARLKLADEFMSISSHSLAFMDTVNRNCEMQCPQAVVPLTAEGPVEWSTD
jgi:hypothetical protein